MVEFANGPMKFKVGKAAHKKALWICGYESVDVEFLRSLEKLGRVYAIQRYDQEDSLPILLTQITNHWHHSCCRFQLTPT
jgi:hypothetical protein